MRIAIIEDEKITADDLAETIRSIEEDAVITAILGSVKSSVGWFQKNEPPDLIFCDIQLGDGLSFEIFEKVNIPSPVIFCTAFDEYALHAFKTNGIDYILKPFTSSEVAEALAKYQNLQKTFSGSPHKYKEVLEALTSNARSASSSVLVYFKDKILPVRLDDIAMFYIRNEATWLITFNKQTYSISKNLEELEKIADAGFFRVNRQCLLNRKAVIDVSQYFSRKLSVNISVPFDEKIIVSKEKAPLFLSWLENAD